MPRKPKTQNQTPVSGHVPDVGNMQTWKALASQCIRTTDGWKVMEIATVLADGYQIIGKHHAEIDKIIGRSKDNSATFSLSFTIDRSETPPEVSVKIGFNESHSDRITSKVPDPDQEELPLAAGDVAPETE